MQVVVVGSLNQDIVAMVDRLPAPGETVLGSDHFVASGGKGANQAVAAARLGRSVAMVGRVGGDAAGTELVASLRSNGVDTSHVVADDGRSGLALIVVAEDGENTIVVSPGANSRLAVDDVLAAGDAIEAADVVLLQLEIPIGAVEAAASLAKGTVILNPAPARALSRRLLDEVAVVVPNRSELAAMTGAEEPDSIEAAAALAGPLAPTVVVTMGAAGAVLVRGADFVHVPAPVVEAVDATAAGDAFCGALADAVARGSTLEAAVRWAVAAGAVAATRLGAQPSLPTAPEVAALVT